MNYDTDIAIIGSGPVGLFTIFQAGMLGMKCCVIDALDKIGGQCSALYPEKPIYDIPSQTVITGQDLINNLIAQADPFKPTYLLNQIASKCIKQDDRLIIVTDKDFQITCKSVVLAIGSGAFTPTRPPISDIINYENKSVFYSITDTNIFTNKNIVIAGGGDSAADWTVELAKISKKIYLVHRRRSFRCSTHTMNIIEKLAQDDKIEFITPYQLSRLTGSNGILNSVIVKNISTKEEKSLPADFLLPFFGITPNLKSICDWQLKIEHNHIPVNPSTLQTNHKRIYAVGDIAYYPGKLKLILNGFAETAMACHDIYHVINPELPLNFQYSTTKGIVKIS